MNHDYYPLSFASAKFSSPTDQNPSSVSLQIGIQLVSNFNHIALTGSSKP